jgi:hypothetical protein
LIRLHPEEGGLVRPERVGAGCSGYSAAQAKHREKASSGAVEACSLHPDHFVEVASSQGFELLEMLSPDKQLERYCQRREEGLSLTPNIYLVYSVKA